MAPELFAKIVNEQKATLLPEPGDSTLHYGTTDEGMQVALLHGRRQDEQLPCLIAITAPNTDPNDSTYHAEAVPLGSTRVRHPSYDGQTGRSSWSVRLDSGEQIFLPSEQAVGDAALARIGSAVIRPTVSMPRRRRHRRAA